MYVNVCATENLFSRRVQIWASRLRRTYGLAGYGGNDSLEVVAGAPLAAHARQVHGGRLRLVLEVHPERECVRYSSLQPQTAWSGANDRYASTH